MGVLNQIDEHSSGIIPSSLASIFGQLHMRERQKQRGKHASLLEWQVYISFFQIYQE